ncbi:hypothetical protein C8A05DRAFT_13895 [Staphylotrichum tortipilum]|uniref:Chromo domain-containing protein n=1 Tax=Staphylotrichum tortipilum TaxID=2831512 RepID=A0AAN6RV67_9PEZI|nr:hypothetical protein C8A05DRAFT_13895 [Staphylotrichum longicolle]
MTSTVAAAKSTKPKRRKPAAAPVSVEEDVLYEVRDILDEKHVKGKLLYKVDWADHPTTGERYNPTWEPAENVTEAAVADWERLKHQRRQPALAPNWIAKRRRERSATEEGDHRPPKRPRGSVDSGYTSTDANPASSWATVQSIPQNRGQIVLEISRPLGFDPSQYRCLSSSQSTPSSQALTSDLVASQADNSSQQARNPISQRTIPDSQEDYLESLRTESTAQSSTNFIDPFASQPEPEQEQEPVPDKEPTTSNPEDQPVGPDLEIPSHQPGGSHPDPACSSNLLETHEAAQGASGDPLSRPSSSKGGQEDPSQDNPWGQGFLTQPDFDVPIDDLESPGAGEPLSSNQELEQDHQQEHVSAEQTLNSGSGSHPHSQAAQQVSVPDSNPDGLLTQVSETAGPISSDLVPETSGPVSSNVVPETVQKPLRHRPVSRSPSQSSVRPEDHQATHPSTSERTTPQSQNMDARTAEAPAEAPPSRSAVEMMRKLREDSFGPSPISVPPPTAQPTEEPALVSPSAILPPAGSFAEQLEASAAPADEPVDEPPTLLETSPTEQPLEAVEEFDHGMGMDFSMHAEGAVGGDHDINFEHPPQTVAPADLTTSVEHIPSAHDDLSVGDQILGGELEEAAPISAEGDPEDFSHEPGVDEQDEDDDSHSRHFTVTLPMAANTRATYLEIIEQNKASMIKFAEVFATSYTSVPDTAVLAKIDSIFERLLNLCDLPAYEDDLRELGKEEMMKHATNSNSKFLFVYEFLAGLWDINSRVLVLSAPGRVFEYLEAVVAATDCPYSILGQEEPKRTDGASVILAVAGQDLSMLEGGVDVVIAFDHAARAVELPATLAYESMAPIVLSLVATYSLDHIDQQFVEIMEQDMDSLVKRNALNLATAKAREYLRTPENRHVKPHEAAKTFADFLRSPEIGLDWEPHPLPADVFEIWLSSQERTQLSQSQADHVDALNEPGGRKRPSDNFDEGTPKRMRLLESQLPSRNATPARMSDLLKQTLVSHTVEPRANAPLIEIPVEQLEKMSAKIAELEAQLATQNIIETKMREHFSSLESQLRSNERTIQSIQPKFMEALKDRGTFAKQCQNAVEKATAATARLEAQKAEVETLKEKNKALEAKLSETTDILTNSTVPEIAQLAQAEKARTEALSTIEKVEKKLRTAQNEADYSRKAYQDASNAHTELDREFKTLRASAAELERRAGANLLRIHQIQAEGEARETARRFDELRATLENRERELERAKDELRYLKSGRRETRQSSVPRSPRMGVMSPRPGRGAAGGGGGSRGNSPAPPLLSSDGPGVTGTGATPVPGMTFFPPAGNPVRWSHLRD